jgi:hypothetical protein
MSKSPLSTEFCWDAKKHRMQHMMEYSGAPLCFMMLQTNYNYVIQMMPLPLLLEMRKAVICHGASIWCCRCGVQRKNEGNNTESLLPSSLFYWALVQIVQELASCPVLRTQTRSKMRCGLSVSKQMCSII